MSDIQQRASKIMTEAERDASFGWSWFSSMVRAHPKMGIFVCFVVGVLLDHYLISLVW